MDLVLSEYAQELTGVSKARYREKIRQCGLTIDPYSLEHQQLDSKPEFIPNVGWSDFFLFMISTPSQHTREEIKAWKSMTGSDSFVEAGWIHDMGLYTYNTVEKGVQRFVVVGRVKHSQRMSATALTPWFVAEQSGEVLAAHCTCMAGLGEACSHIAALISSVVKAVQQRKVLGSDACTSKKCTWLPAKRNVSAAQVKGIYFKKPSTTYRTDTPVTSSKHVIPPPSSDDMSAFHASLKQAPTRPVLHHVMDEYADEFIPRSSGKEFPSPLSSLYDPDTLELTYPELLQKCVSVAGSLKITSAQSEAVEAATRQQASNKMWFAHRAGRITASIFKIAARTNVAMPAPSLIKRVCYPEAFRFSTAATRWGCDHEQEAREAYLKKEGINHHNLIVADCGLTISTEHPFLGATPDGIIRCDCCRPRLLEVKCPYCLKDGIPVDGETSNNMCMEKTNQMWTLKQDHQYYYQVQAQLNVCNFDTCMFVLWTQKEVISQEINIDRDFFNQALIQVKHVFVTGVLPELVGKWLSRKPVESETGAVLQPVDVEPVSKDQIDDDPDSPKCFCEKPSFGQMISCSNKSCSIKHFHMECLLLRGKPKGKWYCPYCRKLPKFKGKKKTVKNASNSED